MAESAQTTWHSSLATYTPDEGYYFYQMIELNIELNLHSK